MKSKIADFIQNYLVFFAQARGVLQRNKDKGAKKRNNCRVFRYNPKFILLKF